MLLGNDRAQGPSRLASECWNYSSCATEERMKAPASERR